MHLNILDMTSISITPYHLLGFEKSPEFGTGTHWILCQLSKFSSGMPKFIDEVNYISYTIFLHGSKCFWQYAIQYCLFNTLQTIDGKIESIPSYGVMKVPYYFLLFDKLEYAEVRRLKTVELFLSEGTWISYSPYYYWPLLHINSLCSYYFSPYGYPSILHSRYQWIPKLLVN